MSTAKQRDSGKERFWRTLLQKRRGSKLSVHEFCLEQGVSEASFYAWRRVLKQRDSESVGFVPVQLETENERVEVGGSAGLELVLEHGRVLRIRPDFDAATLVRLLSVLKEGRP